MTGRTEPAVSADDRGVPEGVAEREARLAQEPWRVVGAAPGFFRGSLTSVRSIAEQGELLVLLIHREVKSRYKDSVLGFFWSTTRPLTMLLIYWLVLGRILGAQRSVPEFAIFVFSGLTAWGFYSEIVQQGTASIVANAGLVKKVYVPREIFPLSTLGSATFNFVIQLAILVAFTAVRGQFPTGSRWLYALAGIVLLVVLGAAMSLFLSAVNVYLRDVQYLVDVGFMVLMWASPIVYSWGLVTRSTPDWVQELYLWNPMTLVVFAFHRAFWVAGDGEPFPSDLTPRFAVALTVSLVLLWLAQRVFSRLQGNFAQEL
ncbi:ABC transporter permease [Cellulomonas sp. NPDC089187]|uniref:ABC transporter permease n=1 Tax=Cellulomonas sp. NPDC089187 TaxID=3154970 RepID=UPI00341BFB8D